jgi:hypothetical protein
MKALETKYKGYRFRSRLEARWAVFFDALGIKWEYESQGFDLGGGVRYLPDFLLDGEIYAEVKPRAGDIGQFDKAMLMARHGARIICLGGTPDALAYPILGPDENHPGQFEKYDVVLNACGKYSPFYWCSGGALWEDQREVNPWIFEDGGVLSTAIEAARGARFEHGESGARLSSRGGK